MATSEFSTMILALLRTSHCAKETRLPLGRRPPRDYIVELPFLTLQFLEICEAALPASRSSRARVRGTRSRDERNPKKAAAKARSLMTEGIKAR
jgi:hypothetical protein